MGVNCIYDVLDTKATVVFPKKTGYNEYSGNCCFVYRDPILKVFELWIGRYVYIFREPDYFKHKSNRIALVYGTDEVEFTVEELPIKSIKSNREKREKNKALSSNQKFDVSGIGICTKMHVPRKKQKTGKS